MWIAIAATMVDCNSDKKPIRTGSNLNAILNASLNMSMSMGLNMSLNMSLSMITLDDHLDHDPTEL